ncbi:MAG TPA: DMT family transporter [Porticoccaceae bacterium]|nr:DMT family transporter [Porticoccaceae bacterium]
MTATNHRRASHGHTGNGHTSHGHTSHPYLTALGAAACFSGNIVVGRAMQGVIPPFALTFWRWSVVVLVLLPFTAATLWRHRLVIRRHWPALVALGCGSVTLYNGFFYLGVQHSSAINGALITSSMPLTIALCAWVFAREPISPRQWIAIALSLFGIVAILARGDPAAVLGVHFRGADLWLLAASLCWALYSVLLRRSPAELNGLPFLCLTSAAGVIATMPAYLWERASGATMAVTPASLGAIAFLALVPALSAYFLYARAVLALGPTRTGIFLNLSPVFAIAAAILFLGERLHGHHLFGVAMITLALLLNSRRDH